MLEKILKVAVKGGASEVILKVGSVPRFRFRGELHSLSDGQPINDQTMESWVHEMTPKHLKTRLADLADLDFSFHNAQGQRFRVNVFRQRGSFGIVLRIISQKVKTMDELGLPQIIYQMTNERRGLIIVTGATGSGKSTTLSSMIEQINRSRAAHIITIEDPIEFIYQEAQSTINQREIGIDTPSFVSALRSALRQTPDVILVGELRDRETTETALMAAETGHLVLTTLHTQNASETVSRLLSYFPHDAHLRLRLMLSQTLNAIISQRLLPRQDGEGMVPALEILIANALIKEQITSGADPAFLTEAIRHGQETYGMMSFDQSIMELLRQGIISEEVAISNASDPKGILLSMRGIGA